MLHGKNNTGITRSDAERDDVVLKLNSMLIALMITANLITEVLVRLPFFKNFSNNIVVLGAALAIASAKVFYTHKFRVLLPTMMVTAFTLLWYLYTLFFHYDDSTLEPAQFVLYVLVPVYAISQKADGEYVLRYVLYIGFMSVPVSNSFFVLLYENINQANLQNIYTLLIIVIAAMIHFSLYRKQSNIAVKLAYVYAVYILVKALMYANRGAIVCLLFCLSILIINSYDGEQRRGLTNKSVLAITLLVVTGLLSVLFFVPILHFMESVSYKLFHSVPSFISKMLIYIQEGDISDGRGVINSFTLDCFGRQPLFGYGIKTFQAVASREAQRTWPYPHQYIYQYLFEGGIIFGALPSYLSISITAKTIFRRIPTKKEFALCCILICTTLPKLLFSTDAWTSTSIWMLITYSLIYIMRRSESVYSAKKLSSIYGGKYVNI